MTFARLRLLRSTRATALLVLLVLTAGCGSGDSNSNDTPPPYCAAASQLKSSADNLENVDVSKNGLGALRPALNSVATDAEAFAKEAKSAFAPQTKAVQSSLSGLQTAVKAAVAQPSAMAITTVRSSMTTLKTSVNALESAAANKCP